MREHAFGATLESRGDAAEPWEPIRARLLRSRLHGLLSGSLLLVTYTGRRSGRTFTIPVLYAEDGSDLLVYVGRSAEKVWWRNLGGGAPVHVRLRGQELAGTATAVVDDPELQERYVERFPRAAKSLAADATPVFVRITGLTLA